MVYHRVLNIVPCAMQQGHVVYTFKKINFYVGKVTKIFLTELLLTTNKYNCFFKFLKFVLIVTIIIIVGDNRGWDGWMASLSRWTWIWASSGSWWWTGRSGTPQSMGSQSWTRLSNWPELIITISHFSRVIWEQREVGIPKKTNKKMLQKSSLADD